MSNYIRSEFYRILHKQGTYMFILICSALLISANVVLAVVKCSEPTFPYATTAFSIGIYISYVAMVFILCIAVATMIFGNEHGNHTMKNTVSYGIPRGTIYFGKFIVTVIYSIVAFVIITGLDVLSAFILLEHSDVNVVKALMQLFAVSLPLFFFVLAATNCFTFILESTGSAIGADVALLFVLPLVSSFLGMKFQIFTKLAKILPWNLIKEIGIKMDTFKLTLPWAGNAGFNNCWLAGIIQMTIILLIGYLIYRRKEVK